MKGFVELLQDFQSDDVPDLQTYALYLSDKMHEHINCKKRTSRWPTRMKF